MNRNSNPIDEMNGLETIGKVDGSGFIDVEHYDSVTVKVSVDRDPDNPNGIEIATIGAGWNAGIEVTASEAVELAEKLKAAATERVRLGAP